ncbi:hypothetical protein [Streptomyces thermoviolaceus]|uniref:hypothetical protein n=1 Tax=Streptomyces thermoviolaceus TaxID=1952 RepID=UPI001E4B8886|nr:hypothetical protein [Streptomyces thermoviolaceus]
MTVTDDGFSLREIAVDPPLTKVFPEDEYDGEDGDDGDSRTFVAHGAAGDLAGFVAVSYERTAGGTRTGRTRRPARS